MELPELTTIESADQARNLAIVWQHWYSENSLSYGEMIEYAEYFTKLATKFDLTDEFKENGII